MNGQFQVAQASGTGNSNNASPPRIFKLTKPLTDQAVIVNLGYDQKVQIDFSGIANDKITLVHVGEKLIILFDNQSTVTVEPFFDSRHDALQNLTIEVAPGRDLSVSEFASSFPITTDESVLPAAGNGEGNAQASGAHFDNPAVDPLPPIPTNVLAPPETLPNLEFTNPTAAVLPISAPTTFLSPSADNFGAATNEDSAISSSLASHVHVGQPGDTLTFTAGTVTTADGGTVTIDAAGAFTYNPDTVAFQTKTGVENLHVGSALTDSFNYTVTDNHGGTATATATITVNVPAEPVAAPNYTETTPEDTVLTVNAAGGVLSLATSGSDDPIHITAVNGAAVTFGTAITLASGAQLTLNADGSYVYNGDTIHNIESQPVGSSVPDSFTYTVTDAHGDTATGTVNLTVTVPAEPVAAPNYTETTPEDTVLTVNAAGGVLSLATSGSDDPIHITAVNGAAVTFGTAITLASGAQLTLNADGSYVYNGDTIHNIESQPVGSSVPDSFTYTVTDAHGDTATGTVNLTVTVPAEPVAAPNYTETTPEDTVLTVNAAGGVLSLATSGSDDPIHITAVNGAAVTFGTAITLASGAQLTLNADGSYVYNGDTIHNIESQPVGSSVPDSFTYTVTDAHGDTATGTVNLTVTVPAEPVAAPNYTETTPEDTVLTVNAAGGVLSLATSGSDDPIHITAVNGAAVTFGTAITLASGAQLTLNADGSYVYNGDTIHNIESQPVGSSVPDSFTYTVTDAHGDTATGTVNLTVTVPAEPVAAPNYTETTPEDTVLTVNAAGGVLSLATSGSDDPIHITAVNGAAVTFGTAITLASGAQLTLNADGSYVYNGDTIHNIESQPVGSSVPDSFTYTVTDAHGDTATGTVNLTVTVPAEPVAAPNYTETTPEDTVLTVNAAGGVLSLATSGSDDPIHITAVNGAAVTFGTAITLASGAQLTLNADGSYVYNGDTIHNIESQPVGSSVPDSFTYTVTDAHGDTATGTVNLTVTVPAEPVAAPNYTETTPEDTVLTVNAAGGVLSLATSGSDDPIHITAVNGAAVTFGTAITLASGAQLTLNADGSYVYNGDTIHNIESQPVGSSVPDSFTYTVTDAHGDTATGTVNLTVTVPAEPVAAPNYTETTPEDTVLTVNAAGGVLSLATSGSDDPIHITAVNGAAVTFGTAITLASGAQLTLNADGSYVYNGDTIHNIESQPVGSSVPDSFTYTVTDAHGDTATGTVNLTVTVPAEPVTTTATVLTGSVDEDGLPGGIAAGDGGTVAMTMATPGSVAGLFSSGADDPLHYSFTASFAALMAENLSSHGVALTYAVTNGAGVETLTATAGLGGPTVFTLTLDESSGATKFTLFNPLDHAASPEPPATGPETSLVINFGSSIQATDSHGDTAVAAAGGLAITVVDDSMIVTTGAAITASVDEGALISVNNPGGTDLYTVQNLNGTWQNGNDSSKSVTTSGTLGAFVQFGADGAAAVDLSATTPTGAFQFTFANDTGATTFIDSLALNSHGDAVDYGHLSIAGGAETLTAYAGVTGGNYLTTGHEVFTLTLNESSGLWTYTLVNPLDDANPLITPTTGTTIGPLSSNETTESQIPLDFSSVIQAHEFDGETATLTGDLSVNVIDDVPTLGTVSTEGIVANTTGAFAGTVGFSTGADGGTEFHLRPLDNIAGLTQTWTDNSDGSSTVIGKVGSSEYFDLTIHTDGTYVFNLDSVTPVTTTTNTLTFSVHGGSDVDNLTASDGSTFDGALFTGNTLTADDVNNENGGSSGALIKPTSSNGFGQGTGSNVGNDGGFVFHSIDPSTGSTVDTGLSFVATNSNSTSSSTITWTEWTGTVDPGTGTWTTSDHQVGSGSTTIMGTGVAETITINNPSGFDYVVIEVNTPTANGGVKVDTFTDTTTTTIIPSGGTLDFQVSVSDFDHSLVAGSGATQTITADILAGSPSVGTTIDATANGQALLGTAQADTINGEGFSNEYLIGNGGGDTLIGGSGHANDQFVINQQAETGATPVTINDFATGDGILVFSPNIAGGNFNMPNPTLASNITDSTGAPTSGNWTSGHTDAFVYDTTNHNLYYSATGAAAQAIEIAHFATGVASTQVHAAVHVY